MEAIKSEPVETRLQRIDSKIDAIESRWSGKFAPSSVINQLDRLMIERGVIKLKGVSGESKQSDMRQLQMGYI